MAAPNWAVKPDSFKYMTGSLLPEADDRPKAGDLIGVAVVVNDADNDAEQMPVGFGLYGGIASDKNPDKYGLLVLAGAD